MCSRSLPLTILSSLVAANWPGNCTRRQQKKRGSSLLSSYQVLDSAVYRDYKRTHEIIKPSGQRVHREHFLFPGKKKKEKKKTTTSVCCTTWLTHLYDYSGKWFSWIRCCVCTFEVRPVSVCPKMMRLSSIQALDSLNVSPCRIISC